MPSGRDCSRGILNKVNIYAWIQASRIEMDSSQFNLSLLKPPHPTAWESPSPGNNAGGIIFLKDPGLIKSLTPKVSVLPLLSGSWHIANNKTVQRHYKVCPQSRAITQSNIVIATFKILVFHLIFHSFVNRHISLFWTFYFHLLFGDLFLVPSGVFHLPTQNLKLPTVPTSIQIITWS